MYVINQNKKGMNRVNTAKELRNEIEKVLEKLDKVIENESFYEIERDIVLERLRRVYDGVRHWDFDTPQAEKKDKQSMIAKPAIDREIIHSLYDSNEVCVRKEEAAERSTQPSSRAETAAIEPATKVLNETFEDDFSIDLASILASRTNSSWRDSLTLNDRLMLLNDLFDHDEALCDKTLDVINESETMDDAYIYLYEHFTLDDSKEGVKRLIALIESKFS